ncbi:hypothetical protein BSL78_15214 [Apostichopus japonicus]|uniref:Uncharacterized protein n=1 Tax=Stichopus japonicus TaxID=307972 RepID=A0A2G8KIU1_STIJA|nr:hypothetical protein BSL78_15214 [Apostichopus japonicus]
MFSETQHFDATYRGNFEVVFSDSSLVVKLPDIKKEVENDEFELESADREEEIDEEEEDSEEEEGEEDQDEDEEEQAIANTEKRQSTEGEDSTDTEMRKNVAELKKMGIKRPVNETPVRRGAPKGRRKKRVPKHLAGLMGEANLCFARGEIDSAATMCLEIVRQSPRSPEPYQLLSLLYEEKGEPDRSLQFALLGAHLNSQDTEEWQKVIEMCMDQNNTDLALYCYSKAIKYAKDKVPLLREKMSLLKEMGEHSRELIVKKMLLKYLPEDRGDEYLELAREMTKHAHDNGDDNSAVQILEKAIKKHRDLVSYEDINMMAELLMAKKDYQKTLWFLTSSCSMTCQQEDGEIAGVKEELDVSRVTSLSVRSELPIDLKVILSVCLIHLDAKQIVIQQNLEPLFEESPEMMGDLYLDVAEAYLDKGNNEAARPILALLVNSKNYNLRPDFLGTIEQQAGRTKSALDLLSFDVEDGASSIPQDIQLVYRKCLLLHNTEHHEEFSHLALLLLKQYYCKGQADKSSEEDDEETQTFSGDISMITQTDWYNLLLKACQALKLLQRYQDMVDITQSAVNNEKLRDFHDRKELVNLEFLLVLSQFFNGEYRACYSVLRNMTKKYADNNRFMNFFSLVTNLSNERKHYRYCLRMTIKIFPDNFAFCYLNGCNAMVRGSYKHALGEFVIALRQNVEAPYPNFCIGLCFFHLANQKFIDKRHSVILQGFAFMKRYEKYRGACQETYYNIGRALHGVETIPPGGSSYMLRPMTSYQTGTHLTPGWREASERKHLAHGHNVMN